MNMKEIKKNVKIKSYSQQWDFHRETHYHFYAKDELIGTCYVIDNGDTYTLTGVYIQDEYRGKGYSKFMLKYITDIYKELHLKVRKDNKIALNLYKQYKFKYYEDSESGRYKWMKNYDKK